MKVFCTPDRSFCKIEKMKTEGGVIEGNYNEGLFGKVLGKSKSKNTNSGKSVFEVSNSDLRGC